MKTNSINFFDAALAIDCPVAFRTEAARLAREHYDLDDEAQLKRFAGFTAQLLNTEASCTDPAHAEDWSAGVRDALALQDEWLRRNGHEPFWIKRLHDEEARRARVDAWLATLA